MHLRCDRFLPAFGIHASTARDGFVVTVSLSSARIRKIILRIIQLRVFCNFGHGVCLYSGINLQ
jgi:hypothetical protein